ncbi:MULTISPECIES: hypothetical protein [Xanthomonas]|uniref:hypothetical protein n=1 Tax=Xanthomonas TaxID=338 RepID=UPI001ADD4C06|nr:MULTISPECIES: hypothetical protein [unclassified Xanthomonas]MBO9874988.1 hypothetical protein [Xanthomonas sp. D-93]WNH45722.1 hypothetical protein PG878_04445 [Xanthomonas sp. A6251]
MNLRFLCAPVLLALTACGAVDTMKNAYAHSQEVAADLEKSVGSKPAVGFNWANGSLVQVTVSFQGVPHKPLAQIVQLSKDSVATRFEQAPGNVVVTFTVPGK